MFWNKLTPMSSLAVLSWLAWLSIILIAIVLRSRPYGIFLGVILGIYTLTALPLLPLLRVPAPLLYVLHGSAYLHWLLLIWPRMRPAWFRALISLPSLYFSAAVLLAFPWAIAAALGFRPWLPELPFLLAAVGLFQSLTARSESHHIQVGTDSGTPAIARLPLPVQKVVSGRPLKIVQITDPHLGPFMSVKRLRSICERAVRAEPDLIVLTGDFLTMESQGEVRWLRDALAPLREKPGQVFACLGNHDHEALAIVKAALHSADVELLVDEARVVETEAGPVQIVGFDFAFTDRSKRMEATCRAFPRVPGALRLALLHDPGAFRHLPAGEADLVLSGHTHGGQLGLVSFRMPWTVVSWIAKMPDHGLWGRGFDRLYVHRGTGHYGFPLRLGVPAEESVLAIDYTGWVHRPSSPS